MDAVEDEIRMQTGNAGIPLEGGISALGLVLCACVPVCLDACRPTGPIDGTLMIVN